MVGEIDNVPFLSTWNIPKTNENVEPPPENCEPWLQPSIFVKYVWIIYIVNPNVFFMSFMNLQILRANQDVFSILTFLDCVVLWGIRTAACARFVKGVGFSS